MISSFPIGTTLPSLRVGVHPPGLPCFGGSTQGTRRRFPSITSILTPGRERLLFSRAPQRLRSEACVALSAGSICSLPVPEDASLDATIANPMSQSPMGPPFGNRFPPSMTRRMDSFPLPSGDSWRHMRAGRTCGPPLYTSTGDLGEKTDEQISAPAQEQEQKIDDCDVGGTRAPGYGGVAALEAGFS